MRAHAGMLAVACLLLAGCRMPSLASKTPTPSPGPDTAAVVCPDGKPAHTGLSAFGAYIGTWQANHQRGPQGSDYTLGTVSGRVSVRCSPADFVVVEAIDLTFDVPGGRALQYALSELPADSKRVYDHTHPACRQLQYQSRRLASQLGAEDPAGLADIVLQSSTNTYISSVAVVTLETATTLNSDARPCL